MKKPAERVTRIMDNLNAAETRSNSAFRDKIGKAGDITKQFLIKNRAYILAFFLPVVILIFAYIIFGIWPNGSRSVLALDLNAQYVYYFDYIYDVLAGDESLFYSWSRNLSGEFVGIIGYYLASPFNIFVWLWDRTWITEGLLTMMLVKAGACGLTTALLLKKHRGYSETTTVVFSLMYALCGYFVVQTMDPMWLDGLIALPLVVMGVERVCDKRRFKLYVLSLVYVFVANFYIGYMVGIFSALYFFYYLASGKSTNKRFGEYCGAVLMYGAASVSAILMSCFMILPVYKSLSNGKFEFSVPDYSLAENFDFADTFIKLFPISYDTVRMEGMPALYAGTLALVFVVIYFMSRKFPARERISGAVLIGLLFLCMYIRPVDMMWHGGQMPNWLPYRYSFIISFLIVLFGASAFEHIKSVKGKCFGIAFGILLAMLLYADLNNEGEYYDAVLTIAVPLAILAIICISAYVFRKYRDAVAMKITMTVLICAECLLNTSVSLYQMHDDIVFSDRHSYRWEIPNTREVTNQVHEQDSGFYRMEKTYHRCVNDPIALRMYGLSHSSSMLNAKAIDVIGDLGITSREHYTRYDGSTMLMDDIFGVKYVLATDPNTLPYTDVFIPKNKNEITVYQNTDALGFAYLADDDILSLERDTYVEDGVEFGSPFRLQNAMASALIGDQCNVFVPITEVELDTENIRVGATTDAHESFRKKDTDEPGWITYTVTTVKDGPVYMYLPTLYERETKLFVNDVYRCNYFKYENFSIEYLGTFKAGESFEIKLELLEDAMYFKDLQIYYADVDELERFNAAMHSRNTETALTRTDADSLSIKVNAAEGDVLFTTIPAEEGWTVLIDGNETQWTTSMGGSLICVELPEGQHTVEMHFFPAGLKSGLILSFSGLLLFVIMILVLKQMKKRESITENN